MCIFNRNPCSCYGRTSNTSFLCTVYHITCANIEIRKEFEKQVGVDAETTILIFDT
jgi:hypothetical protein